MARKIVLTGGTGFILGYVAERYAAMGEEVVLFDNNQQHALPAYTQALLKGRDNVHLVVGDIADRKAVESVMKGADVVYHFAALMGTSARFRQEVRTAEVNVIGMLNACQAALDAGVKRFIYPPRPVLSTWLTPYIITKTAATQFAQMYHQVYGLPTVGLLIANCYGPRERAVLEANTLRPGEGRKMMATFIEAGLKGEPLPVMGDGEQSSDFVFVDDVVDACMKADCDAAVGAVMDIGSGVSTPVKDVAKLVIELTDGRSQIKFTPLRTGEAKVRTVSDVSAAKKLLGWAPRVSLREGLRRTIPWYAKQLGVKVPDAVQPSHR